MFLPIVLTCDNKYFKYASVVISSVLENSNPQCTYEFNILSEYISDYNKKKSKLLLQKHNNAVIKFIELKNINTNIFYLNSYMTASTYYRFYIPEIFNNYDRILHLDCDLIVDYDISNLAKIDFENKLAICCYSTYIRNIIKEGGNENYPISYFTDILNMKVPQEYFNAGVMMYNIKLMIEKDISNKLFESLKKIEKPKLQDQDILNSVFSNNGGVKFIDQLYNNTRAYKITKRRIFINRLKQNLGIKDKNKLFFIYHYVGKNKPWKTDRPDNNLFYFYAKKTPFYKEIINENLKP